MNFRNKINQYLLERYPTIWNTQIVWMLLFSFIIHIVFFVMGFLSHSNPTSLQTYNVLSDYANDGYVLVNIIASILLLVAWLIFMFKNNAFKQFYPTSSGQLFGQFVQYFIIIFVSISFYFSYMFGLTIYIGNKYDDASMKTNIELINNVYPFLSHSPEDYMLDRRKYPAVFNELYCETDSADIDFSKKYYTYYDFYYQFNYLYSKKVTEKDEYLRFVYPAEEEKLGTPLAYIVERDSFCIFYFKERVADVSEYIQNANLNYGNFSLVFYIPGNNNNYYSEAYYWDEYYYDIPDFTHNIEQNKKTVELLERNNPEEFRKLFADFIQLSDRLKIKHNLSVDEWMKLVYFPPHFEVKHFINKSKPYTYAEDESYTAVEELIEPVATGEGNTLEDFQVTLRRQFEQKAQTDFYYESSNLSYTLNSIDDIKTNRYWHEMIHVFLWIAFCLSAIIFSYRVTHLRSLLFSIITAGVLALLCSLLFVLVSSVSYDFLNYFATTFLLILGAVILGLSFFFPQIGSKLFRSILINLSINGIVAYVFLIIATISLYQQKACDRLNALSEEYISCSNLLDQLGARMISTIMLISGFVFILCYSMVIKKWKASAE